MLVEQLSIAYKCHSSIGNSINLKEMIHEVLKTFVSESYAIYSEFLVIDDALNLTKIDSFGRIENFDANKYQEYTKALNLINEEKIKVLKINLENGIIFLVSKNNDVDCSFFVSMFESLVPKLNISVNACINFEKLEKTNEYLKEQKKELIKANKTKDDFLSNMSHELKTPLNSITVISSIMVKNKDNQLNETQIKNMQIIKKSADDLLILINDILDISKIEAGALNIFKDNFNLKTLLDEILDSFEELAIQKNIELQKEFIGVDFNIFSDEKRLSQILKNFLSNAVKFTSKGYVKVKVQELENFIEIEVIDTGIGISPTNLEHIFDRFKQIDDSRTRKYGGTGLGLTISKELSNMLNYELEVSSCEQKGSVFKLTVPKNEEKYFLYKDKKNDNIFEEKDEITQNMPIVENETKKIILLMLQNSVIQFKLTISLKKEGFEIVPFFNIEEFKKKFTEYNEKKVLFLLDENILDSNLIIEKCKDSNIKVISINSKEFDEIIFQIHKNLYYLNGEI